MPEFLTINATAAQRLATRSSGPMVARTTEMIARHARLIAPGSMKQHIRAITGSGAAPIGIVVCDHHAAVFVIHGTRPHTIVPRSPGGVLRFKPKGGGNYVFAKVVHHPGTQPNNFLLKALRSV